MYDNIRTPWKNVGNDVRKLTQLEAVIQTGGLDFVVEKAPVNYNPFHHEKLKGLNTFDELPDYYVTYRTDTGHPFGIVGSKYQIIQNMEAFRFIELLYQEANIEYETAGIFNNGSKMFVAVKLPGEIIIDNQDKIDKYLVFTTTHDGSGSITIVITGVRPICENTLQMAIRTASNKYIIKHTKNAAGRIDEARQLLQAQSNYFKDLGQILLALKTIKVDNSDIDQTLAYMYLAKNEYDTYIQGKFNIYTAVDKLSTKRINSLIRVREALDNAPGQEWHKGTGLWLYNGLTSYNHNIKSFKSEDARVTSIMEDSEGAKLSHVVETLIANR